MWKSFKHLTGNYYLLFHKSLIFRSVSQGKFCYSSLPAIDLEKYVYEELRTSKFIRPGSSMSGTTFISDVVKKHVICVKFGDVSELMYSYCLVSISY